MKSYTERFVTQIIQFKGLESFENVKLYLLSIRFPRRCGSGRKLQTSKIFGLYANQNQQNQAPSNYTKAEEETKTQKIIEEITTTL